MLKAKSRHCGDVGLLAHQWIAIKWSFIFLVKLVHQQGMLHYSFLVMLCRLFQWTYQQCC